MKDPTAPHSEPQSSDLSARTALPLPAPQASQVGSRDGDATRARARLDALVLEAKASERRDAAILWFEAGKTAELELVDLKIAASFYQESHVADPAFLPVIHAARRLFAQLGKWGAVAMMLDKEIAVTGSPVPALLVEKARLFASRLQRAEDAPILYQQALAVSPAYGPAVDGLVRDLSARGAYAEVVAVLRAAAKASLNKVERATWLLELGRLCETKLRNDDDALQAYEAADAALPLHRPTLEALLRCHTRRGNIDAIGDVLQRLLEKVSPAEAVALLCERGRSLAGAAREKDAIATLERARALVPDDALVLRDLAFLYQRLEMWPEAADALEHNARVTRDQAELIAVYAEAAKIADERLNDNERAIRLYTACVEVEASYAPALTALGKLYARAQRYAELSAIYEAQVGIATDPQQKTALLFRQAELLAERLDDAEGALRRLSILLEISPTWGPALKLTATLSLKLARYDDVIATYEREISPEEGRHPDREHTLLVLEKIANIVEDHLKDLPRAVTVYRRMLDVMPAYLPALRALGRLYARLEKYEELVAINAEEAQVTSDQGQTVALLHKNGELLADKLGRIDDAIANFKQALALVPTYLPALRSLGGIYARSGRYLDLIAMHREEAEVCKRPEQRAHLLFQVAQLYDERLKDTANAAAAYREVLTVDATFRPALRALAGISMRTNAWAELLAIHEAELALIKLPTDRAILRTRIAELLDARLQRPDDAVAVLQEAVKDAPTFVPAHDMLVAIFARQKNPKAEVEARERMHAVLDDSDSRAANNQALMQMHLYDLDDAAGALRVAQRALSESPNDVAALRVSLTCAMRVRDYGLAVQLGERLASLEQSVHERAHLQLLVASWKEADVEPPGDPLPNYVAALDAVPENPTAQRAIERLYLARGCYDGLYLLYDRERKVVVDPVRCADLSMKMGEIAEFNLNDRELALKAYHDVLKILPNHLPAITRLRDIYGALGKPSEQLHLLTLEAAASRDPARAIATLLETAQIQRDRFGNVDAAIDCFLRVLERDPLHSTAYQSLETLLVANSRWEELADVYVKRAQHAFEPAQQVELLSKAAHMYGDRLKRPGEAAEVYEKILAIMPSHPSALLQLGNVRYALGEWQKAEYAFGLLVQQSSDPMVLTPVHEKMGVILTEHLVDAPRAIMHLTSALAMNPDNRDARRRLAYAYGLVGSVAQAFALYRQLAESAMDRREKRELNLILARLLAEQRNDTIGATAHLEVALAHCDAEADRVQVLDALVGLYERSGDLAGLVLSTLKQAEQAHATDPRRAIALLLRAAELQATRLREPEAAIKTVQRALDMAPDDPDVRLSLAQLYAQMPNQQLLATEEHRRIVRSGHVRLASVRGLMKAWQHQRAFDRSLIAAEILSFFGAAESHEEVLVSDARKKLKKGTDLALTPEQVTSWLCHPQERGPVRDLVALVAPDLQRTLASTAPDANVDRKLMLRPRAEDPVRALVDELGANLNAPVCDVYRSAARRHDVVSYTASPYVVVIGTDAFKTQPLREQRFLVARQMMALVNGHTLVEGSDEHGVALLVSAVCRAVDKSAPAFSDHSELENLTRKVSGALSRKTRATAADIVARLVSLRQPDFRGYIEAVPLSQARAGVLLSGAFDAAVRVVAKEVGRPLSPDAQAAFAGEPRLSDLFVFALSEEHFQARQALHIGLE